MNLLAWVLQASKPDYQLEDVLAQALDAVVSFIGYRWSLTRYLVSRTRNLKQIIVEGNFSREPAHKTRARRHQIGIG